MWNELPFSRDLHSKVDLFRMSVSHFKLWRPAILQPVDPGKVILPLWKALSPRNWNLAWKLEYLGAQRPQSKFSEGGAFLVNWAVAPPGWCHTQFLYKFWKLCVRAFKWYLISVCTSSGLGCTADFSILCDTSVQDFRTGLYSYCLGKCLPGKEQKWRPTFFSARKFHFPRS